MDIAGTAGLDFACFGRARNSPHYAQQQPANVLLDTHVKDDDLIWVSGSDYAECDEIS